MEYQDCATSVQVAAADINDLRASGLYAEKPDAEYFAGDLDADVAAADATRLTDANINPSTGLATDYLNHFNEAIMLLEMVATCPDCLDDFHNWQPMSYREHFLVSRFRSRDLAIAAYESADPASRALLDSLAATMTEVIEATRAIMTAEATPETAGTLAERSAAWLKLLVARAGAVINGAIDIGRPDIPQTAVDRLMLRSA